MNYITYAQLMEGGELRFTLTDTPNTGRGTSAEAAPYSYTNEATVSIPYVDKDLNLFLDKVSVTLGTTTAGAQIHYTLDGTEPTEESPVYTQPIELTRTTQLKAKGFKDGFRPSRTLSIEATKYILRRTARPISTTKACTNAWPTLLKPPYWNKAPCPNRPSRAPSRQTTSPLSSQATSRFRKTASTPS